MKNKIAVLLVVALAFVCTAASGPAVILTLPSMSALQGMTAAVMALNPQVQVLDYYSTTVTNGGGTFVFTTSAQISGATPDGGVIVAPSDHAGTCSFGCMVRRTEGLKVRISWWGGYGDGIAVQSTGLSTSSGSPNVTILGGFFTQADAGSVKIIEIPGAGVAGATLFSKIQTVTDATHIVLTSNASTTLTTSSQALVYGHDDTTARDAARSYLASFTAPSANQSAQLGGSIYYPRGIYLFATPFSYSSGLGTEGEGGVITQAGVGFGNTPYFNAQAITEAASKKVCCTIFIPSAPQALPFMDTAPHFSGAISGNSGIATGGGTVDAGHCAGLNYVTLAAGASSTNDTYNGNIFDTTGGTGSGQERTVACYDGATRHLSPSWAFTVLPDATTVYSMPAKTIGQSYSYKIGQGENSCTGTSLPRLSYTYSNNVSNITLISLNDDYEGWRFFCAAHGNFTNLGSYGFQVGGEWTAGAYNTVENTYFIGSMIGNGYANTDQNTYRSIKGFGGRLDTMTAANIPWFVSFAGLTGLDPNSSTNTAHYGYGDALSTFDVINGEEYPRSFFIATANGTAYRGLHMENWTMGCPMYLQGGQLTVTGMSLFEGAAGAAICGESPDVIFNQIVQAGASTYPTPSILGTINCTYAQASVRIYSAPPMTSDTQPQSTSCVYWDNYGRPPALVSSSPYTMSGHEHSVLKNFAGVLTVNLPSGSSTAVPLLRTGWCTTIANIQGDNVTITVAAQSGDTLSGPTTITGTNGSGSYQYLGGRTFFAVGSCPTQSQAP